MSDPHRDDTNADDLLEYDDFYELLGVSEDASTDQILDASRELLAKYHPDSSSDDKSRDVFKAVNRAQDVLTDTEQRAVYDYLGHDKYIRKREEGNISLSDEFKEQLQDIKQGTDDSERITREDIDTKTDDDQGKPDVTYSFANLLGTESIEGLTADIAYQSLVSRIYTFAWGLRLAGLLLTMGIVLFYGPFNELWDMLNILQHASQGMQSFAFIVSVGVVIGLNTVWFGHSRIPHNQWFSQSDATTDTSTDARGTQDTASHSSPFSHNTHDTSDSDDRGLNTGDDTTADASDTISQPSVVKSHFSKDNTDSNTRDHDEYINRSWTVGMYSLVVAFVLLVVGGIAGTRTPITFFEALVGWHAGIPFWIGSGNGMLIKVFNVLYVVLLGIALVVGTALSTNGISKQIWREKYVNDERLSLLFWDGILVAIADTVIASLVYGNTPITIVTLKGRSALFDLAVFGHTTPTILDIGIIASLSLVVVANGVKLNVWVSQKLTDN